MEEFYTRTKANEGVKLPLSTPDGKETDHWLMIRGVDSDAFREAEADAKRSLIQKKADPKEAMLSAVSALVSDWSFDKPCTQDAVKDFLREAPQIADSVDKVAGDRKLFFALRSSSSNDSPEENLQPGEPSTESAKETT